MKKEKIQYVYIDHLFLTSTGTNAAGIYKTLSKSVLRIQIRIGFGFNGAPGSGSGFTVRIRIRIQGGQK
jgi:hypothetical protein